jgi:hypothetical protein
MACWGWGRSPYWWDYPNSWPPHTCRDLGPTWGQTWWDLWWNHLLRMWHDWHYTQGWGSLGTITVAVLAIISSALYNRRTLRQARAIGDNTLALARQQRADTRGDVLRTELSRWLTVVSEIERSCAELLRRTREINLQRDENDALDAAEIYRRARELKSAVRQELSEALTNYDTQRTQIQMLTADEIIATNIHLITQAMIGKIQNLNKLIDTLLFHANRTPDEQQREHQNFMVAALFAPAQDHQYTRQITASRGDLINYIIARFNPAAVGTVARVIRNYPNVLQQLRPTSVIVPPPQPQQPQQPPPPSAPASPPDPD